jgi:thioredoxin 1
MSKIIESESELDKILSECSNIFVLFYASYCPYSRQFLPVFEKYSKNNEHKFCRVVTDHTPECEDKYDIEIVPTVIYFENGRAAKRLDGIAGEGLDEYQLKDLISSCESGSGKNAKSKRK